MLMCGSIAVRLDSASIDVATPAAIIQPVKAARLIYHAYSSRPVPRSNTMHGRR